MHKTKLQYTGLIAKLKQKMFMHKRNKVTLLKENGENHGIFCNNIKKVKVALLRLDPCIFYPVITI